MATATKKADTAKNNKNNKKEVKGTTLTKKTTSAKDNNAEVWLNLKAQSATADC